MGERSAARGAGRASGGARERRPGRGHAALRARERTGKRGRNDGLAQNHPPFARNDRKQENTPMQLASASTGTPQQPPRDMLAGEAGSATASNADPRLAQYKIIRRNGAVVGFEPAKISIAMTKAFLAVNGGQGAASARIREVVAGLTDSVVGALMRRQPAGGTFHIEDVQDQVELALMRSGEHEVARAYVLYRDERARERAAKRVEEAQAQKPAIQVSVGGVKQPLDVAKLEGLIASACEHLHEG